MNSDLIGKFINIGSRTAKFINDNFHNKLSLNPHNEELINEFINRSPVVYQAYEQREYSKAIREIMRLADKANQYIDKMQPWVLIKDKDNNELVQSVCTTSLNLFRLLAIMLIPVLPKLTTRVFEFLSIKTPVWEEIDILLLDHKISKYKPLLTRIDEANIEKIRKQTKES